MIAHLTGQVIWRGEDSLILATGGVGYVVHVPRALARSVASDTNISLWIETLVREDAITLYGFETLYGQHLFRLLLSVQGVGARLALGLLSTFTPPILVHLVTIKDKKTLVQADGVGPKLAERLVLELKDKILKLGPADCLPDPSALDSPSPCAPLGIDPVMPPHTLVHDAQEALRFLGYRPSEISPILEACFNDPATSPKTLDDLVKKALVRLSPEGYTP